MPAVLIRRSGLALLLAACSTLALAQAKKEADIDWVPTPDVLVDRMLDMAGVGPKDVVIDLGAGDGRIVIAAAKRGARAIGVELEAELVEYARRSAQKAGVADKASFLRGDLFEADLSKATVITLFLLPELNLKLRPKLLALRPGTRIVSTTFDMGDWQADETSRLGHAQGCPGQYCTALLWIVPARVAGTLTSPAGTFYVNQQFQMLSGNLMTVKDQALPLTGKVRGEEFELVAGGRSYHGRVRGREVEIR